MLVTARIRCPIDVIRAYIRSCVTYTLSYLSLCELPCPVVRDDGWPTFYLFRFFEMILNCANGWVSRLAQRWKLRRPIAPPCCRAIPTIGIQVPKKTAFGMLKPGCIDRSNILLTSYEDWTQAGKKTAKH